MSEMSDGFPALDSGNASKTSRDIKLVAYSMAAIAGTRNAALLGSNRRPGKAPKAPGRGLQPHVHSSFLSSFLGRSNHFKQPHDSINAQSRESAQNQAPLVALDTPHSVIEPGPGKHADSRKANQQQQEAEEVEDSRTDEEQKQGHVTHDDVSSEDVASRPEATVSAPHVENNGNRQNTEEPSSPPTATSKPEPTPFDDDESSLAYEPVASSRTPPPVGPTPASPEAEEPPDDLDWDRKPKIQRHISEEQTASLEDMEVKTFRSPPPVSLNDSLPDEEDLISAGREAHDTADTLVWEPRGESNVWSHPSTAELLQSLNKVGPIEIPLGTEYSSKKSYALAVLSAVVYESFDRKKMNHLMGKLFGSNYVRSYLLARNGSKAILVECRNLIVVSWCGTNDSRFWQQNRRMRQVQVPYLAETNQRFKVHDGFLKYTDLLLLDVLQRLDTLLARKPRQVMMTGHSLGGAAALINALCFEARRGTQNELNAVFTYGQPRVVNRNLAVYCQKHLTSTKRLYRFTHHNDTIPRVAPTTWGFAHVGVHLHIRHQRAHSRIISNPSSWQTLRDRSFSMWHDLFNGSLDHITDHISDYWKSFEDGVTGE